MPLFLTTRATFLFTSYKTHAAFSVNPCRFFCSPVKKLLSVRLLKSFFCSPVTKLFLFSPLRKPMPLLTYNPCRFFYSPIKNPMPLFLTTHAAFFVHQLKTHAAFSENPCLFFCLPVKKIFSVRLIKSFFLFAS